MYAVIGGILGSLMANIPNILWGLHWSWKQYGVKADFRASAKIFVSSAIAAVSAYAFVSIFKLLNLALLIGGFAVFSIVYLTASPLLGSINQIDINNLKATSSGLSIVPKMLALPFLFLQKMCKLTGNTGEGEVPGENESPPQDVG